MLWGPSQTDAPWPQPPFWPDDYPILLELLGEDDVERIVGVRVEDIDWPWPYQVLDASH